MKDKQTLIVFEDQIARPWPKLRVRLWLVILLACFLYPAWLWMQVWPYIDSYLMKVEEAYERFDAKVVDGIRWLADWLAGPAPSGMKVGAL